MATSTLNAARGLEVGGDPQDRLDHAVDQLAAARTHLARVGNNLNQIAFALNSGGYPRPGELETVLSAVRQAVVGVDAVAGQLVGR
nr:plasmid mobilization relaxosome protein MobC [Peterkaempfera griseoplana]